MHVISKKQIAQYIREKNVSTRKCSIIPFRIKIQSYQTYKNFMTFTSLHLL